MDNFKIIDHVKPYRDLIKHLENTGFEKRINTSSETYKLFPKNYVKNRDRYLFGWEDCSGFHLHGPENGDDFVQSPNLLNFNFSDESSSKFVKNKQDIWLVRDARVGQKDGRGSPDVSKPMLINGKKFQLITKINDDDAFENILKFHESRPKLIEKVGTEGEEQESISGGSGYDPGSENGGIRSSCTFEAHHHPITKALMKQLEDRGYTTKSCDVFSPDLLVNKGQKTSLFEVKPKADTPNLCTAIGQLLCYDKSARSSSKFLVIPPMDDSDAAKLVKSVLKDNGIKIITFIKSENGNYRFTGLPKE